jgi:hypothetical protein
MLVIDRARLTRGRIGLGQDFAVLGGGAMDTLLEDGFRFVELKLGLEVVEVVRVAAAVRTTAGISEVELLVDDLLACTTPAILIG